MSARQPLSRTLRLWASYDDLAGHLSDPETAQALTDYLHEAADEIDRLKAKLAWSLAVVRQMTDCLGTLCDERYEQRYEAKEPKVCCYDVIEQARALLAGEVSGE